MADNIRCSHDVEVVSPSARASVTSFLVSKSSQRSSTIQLQQSLTPHHPTFYVEIACKVATSKISVGLAGGHIGEGIHTGLWARSVGYHSDSGHCFSSHKHSANTDGLPYSTGDTVGVTVTYFGKFTCTVVFLKNSRPVATRYLFKPLNGEIYATVVLENGPIKVDVKWPSMVKDAICLKVDNPSHWIKPESMSVTSDGLMSVTKRTSRSEIMQSSVPLCQDKSLFQVSLKHSITHASGPKMGVATCSPLHPTPTASLLHDFLYWTPETTDPPYPAGTRLGWGIHYDPEERIKPGFNDKLEQLVLIYIIINTKIVWCSMQLQPEGGVYPIISPGTVGSQGSVAIESAARGADVSELDGLFVARVEAARATLAADVLASSVTMKFFRASPGLSMSLNQRSTSVVVSPLSKEPQLVHCTVPLSRTRNCFFVEITKLSPVSELIVGITGPDSSLHSVPGRETPQSIGWSSLDGGLYPDRGGNPMTRGQRFTDGDIVGVCMSHFGEQQSVILFIKNGRPIATRLLHHVTRECLATVCVLSNRKEVMFDIVWHMSVGAAPAFNTLHIEDWCLPEGSVISADGVIHLSPSPDVRGIQAPYPLHPVLNQGTPVYDYLLLTRDYQYIGWNHYEIKVLDKISPDHPPPAIALSGQSHPKHPSVFTQNYIQFWPVGNAASAVNAGDRIGWGLYYPEVEASTLGRLAICYLTVNTAVALMRVLLEPVSGFYPLIIVPNTVRRVKLEFGANFITQHPFTSAIVSSLIAEAKAVLTSECEMTPETSPTAEQQFIYPVIELNNNEQSDRHAASKTSMTDSYGANSSKSSDNRDTSGSVAATRATLKNSDVLSSNIRSLSQSSPNLRQIGDHPGEAVRADDGTPPFVSTSREGFKKFKDSYVASVASKKGKKRDRKSGHKRSDSMSALNALGDQSSSKSCMIL